MSAVQTPEPMSVLDHAIAYIGLGWSLCSIAPGTKGPTTPGWNKTGAVIGTRGAAQAEFTRNPNNGIGLIHSASGTCAIDVDHLGGWNIILAEYGIDPVALFAGAPRIIGRDDRDKAIFRVPDGFDCSRRSIAWPAMPGTNKPVTVFELRGGPVQDVLPPTIHPDTHQPYRWLEGTEPFGRDIPMLPAQLLAIWKAWDSFKPQFERLCPWAKPADIPARPEPRVRHGSADNGNVIGQFNQAHDVRAMLEAYGYVRRGKRYLSPTSSTKLAGVVVFEDGTHCYTHHASDPLNDGHAHDAFDLYCTFDHNGDVAQAVRSAASLLGIQQLPDFPAVDTRALIENTRKRKARDTEMPKRHAAVIETLPIELTRIPGVLGELVDHIVDSAIKPQRVLAVAASLCFGAVCMARIYASRTDLRTNPYLIAVAPSTAGKDHARKVVKHAMTAVGLKDRIGGEDIKSGSAVFSAVYRSPAVLFQLDEFGLFLKSVTGAAAGSYKTEIMAQLMMMRTNANCVVMGPEYAANFKEGERRDVEYPNAILHGTTTGDEFWPALQSGHAVSGLLNRFTVVHAIGEPERRDEPLRNASDIPAGIVEWATRIVRPEHIPGANLIGYTASAPRVVGETPAASRMLREFARQTDANALELRDTGMDKLWGRAHAQAIEYAMIVAGSLNPSEPVITEVAASWAIAFVSHWTKQLVADCQYRIVDAEFDAQCASVLRVLRHGKTRDRSYTRREIQSQWWGWRKLRPREQDDILNALVRNGDVVAGKRQGARGPSTEAWMAREFAPEGLVPNDDQTESTELHSDTCREPVENL